MGNVVRKLAPSVAAMLLTALVGGGCTTFQQPEPPSSGTPVRLTGVLTGTATYRERIALLPGSVVRVSLEDTGSANGAPSVVASTTVVVERQVPISFTLAYDPSQIVQTHRYVVGVQIESQNGQRLWTTTESYGVITQGKPDHVDVVLSPARAAADVRTQSTDEAMMGRTQAYQCEGLAFAVRSGQSMAALYLPQDYIVLPQVIAASGARYQQGQNQFWNKGNDATLNIGTQHYTACKPDAARTAQEDAKLRATGVRAGGTEPWWTIVIEKGRWLRFVGDENGASAYMPAQSSNIEGSKTTYRAKSQAHDLHVVVERSPCTEAATGKSLDTMVVVKMDGREYRGCGVVVE